MGADFEAFLLDNMHEVLVFIEVLWVGGFLAVFVIYFMIRWRIKKRRRNEQQSTRKFPSPPD